MKRWQLLICLWCGVGILFSFGQIPPTWYYEPILDDTVAFGHNPRTVQDLNGNIHLVCWNQTADKLVYGFKASNFDNWYFEWIDSSGSNGYSAAIAVDGNGSPHVAYYENVLGKMQLRYADRTSGHWIIESIDSTQNWGQYGLNNQNNEGKTHPSLDLVLQPYPIVVFFDATWIPTQFQYGLELKRAFRIGGVWSTANYGNIPITSVPTSHPDYFFGENIAGARYGEFCQISQSLSGRNYVFTVCNKNGQIIWYPDAMNNSYVVLDSAIRYKLPGSQTDILQLTFEGLSAVRGSNGDYHLSYVLSHQYGRNDYTSELTFLYAKLDPTDSSVVVSEIILPRDAKYRYNTSIAVKGKDTLMISFVERDTRKVRLALSIDRGQNWSFQDIFSSMATEYAAPIIWRNDSLSLICYDIEKERLSYAVTPVGDNFVRKYIIRQSTRYAQQSDCSITGSGSNRTIDILFSDELSQGLWLGQKKNSWSFSRIDSGKTYQNLRLLVGSTGERYALWYQPELQQLVASSEGASPVIIEMGASSADWVGRNDSIHLIYLNQGVLWYRFGTSLTTWDASVAIDTVVQGVAGDFKIVLDPAGLPHVVVQNIGLNRLFYLRKSALGSWVKDEIPLPGNFVMGSQLAIIVGSSLQPQIVCRNTISNSLYYFSRKLNIWEPEMIYQSTAGVAGSYFEIQLDIYENPFVAFSLVNTTEQVRIFKKAYTGDIWYSLPVYQNTDQIGTSFCFQLTRDDVYLLGRRTRIAATGLGMLYSPGGVWASIDDGLPEFAQSEALLYPNPVKNELHISNNIFSADQGNQDNRVFKVYTIDGQIVIMATISSKNPVILLDDLAPGIYTGKIEFSNGREIYQKFVKLP